MSGPMVRAILKGSKTQTRRVITPQPSDSWMRSAVTDWSQYYKPGRFGLKKHLWICHPTENREIVCPYGAPSDRLWVRETFVLEQSVDGNEPPHKDGRPLMHNNDMEAEWDWLQPHYRATDKTPELSCTGEPHTCDGGEPCCHWKPSIFMPRWASRITLEITNVRVEPLHEINEADAIAEGFSPQVCERVFTEAAGKIEISNCYWFEHEETGEEDSGENGHYCRKCALKRQKKLGKKWMLYGDGGSAMESDGPAYCDCGTPLLMSLTEYGIERELRLEDDPEGKEPQHFPVRGMDASIAAEIAGGIGDLQEKHHGRLAQIGFATGWDSLNAKRGYSWKSNPWVWVIEFKKL